MYNVPATGMVCPSTQVRIRCPTAWTISSLAMWRTTAVSWPASTRGQVEAGVWQVKGIPSIGGTNFQRPLIPFTSTCSTWRWSPSGTLGGTRLGVLLPTGHLVLQEEDGLVLIAGLGFQHHHLHFGIHGAIGRIAARPGEAQVNGRMAPDGTGPGAKQPHRWAGAGHAPRAPAGPGRATAGQGALGRAVGRSGPAYSPPPVINRSASQGRPSPAVRSMWTTSRPATSTLSGSTNQMWQCVGA